MDNTREKLIQLLINSPGLEVLFGGEEGFAKNADWLIANGVTVQKWIPVTERLPNLWETVIVCDTREQYVGACMYYGNDDWLHDDKLWDTSEITHWMPLPEPPNCGADMRGEEDV